MKTSVHTAVYVGLGSLEITSQIIEKVNAENYIFIVPGDKAGLSNQAGEIEKLIQKSATVLERAVSATGGEFLFYHYNLDTFSGYGKPANLLKLFPNLAVKGTDTVSTESINVLFDSLLSEQLLAEQKPNYLFIDQPNSASHPCSTQLLVETLSPTHLEFFSLIELRVVSEGLFEPFGKFDNEREGKARLDKVEEYLKSNDFSEAVPKVEEKDPDFQVVAYSRDEIKQNLKDAGAVESELQKKIEELQLELEKERLSSQAKQDSFTKEIKKYEIESKVLLEENQKITQQLKQQVRLVESLKKELEEAKHQQACEKQQLVENKNQLEKDKKQSEQENTRLVKELSQIEQEKQKHVDWTHSLEKQLEESQAEQEAQQQKYEKELETAREDARNAIRLVTIRDGDLKDLQQKYSQALDVQQRQFKLLDTMQARLEQASQYLLQLDADAETAHLLLTGEQGEPKDDDQGEPRDD